MQLNLITYLKVNKRSRARKPHAQITFNVRGVIFSLFTQSGKKSRRQSKTMSFTVWKSLSPFISAQNMRSRSLKPSPLSPCRMWLAAEPFNRTSRTWICFSSIRLRTTLTICRGCIPRVGKFPRPWIGMVSVRMASSRCTCSQLRTLTLLPSVSDTQLVMELLSSSDMVRGEKSSAVEIN